MPRYVSVAVPVPFLDLLTYQIPEELDPPGIGARVLVPLGSRVLTGCVVASGAPPPDGSRDIKSVVDVVDDAAFMPESIVRLALWTADYYMASPGEMIATAMPPNAWIESERRIELTPAGEASVESGRAQNRPRLQQAILRRLSAGKSVSLDALGARLGPDATGGEIRVAAGPAPVRAAARALERDSLVRITQALRGRRAAHKTIVSAALTSGGLEVAGADRTDTVLGLGARQWEALDALMGSPRGMPLPALGDRGIAPSTIGRLARRGLVALRRDRVERDPFESGSAVPRLSQDAEGRWRDRALTGEQSSALGRLTALASAGEFSVALLHGVTGSGKTELYLRLADGVCAAGRQVLVLVPEIGLTPALASILRAAFGDRVAIQHSGLSDGERYDQWQRIRRGEVDVVVGTRSAVFAPLASPGLIIVDEEHDASYKQDESPRYNGRDVAIVRGREAGALVVLGSATPSMETYHNALSGRYERLVLERRVLDRPLAAVRIVNMRPEYSASGPDVILSTVLREAIACRLARHEQVLLLLNRRGLAVSVFCRECAATIDCPNCSISLAVHTAFRDVRRARCHYCNHSVRVPKTCPRCGGPYLEQMGFGTERVQTEVAGAFPDARICRLDRDTVRRRGALVDLLARFAGREVDILVGTQMIAKGHDFPGVTLVGVISADVGLGLADFRAAERTFQLLTQVAGRAGRGEQAGEAIVQTLFPEHYSIQHACRQDYPAFFADESRFRKAMRYPPAVSLINAIVRARTFGGAMDDAADLAERLRAASNGETRFRVLGPAPAPLGRLRGDYRAQCFLKGTRRGDMRAALRSALAEMPDALRRRITVDVDPLSVL